MIRDPLLDTLTDAIQQIATRVLERPDWVLDSVSAIDRALIQRVLELAVVAQDNRHDDVVH